jgi:translation initiation factor RLI1
METSSIPISYVLQNKNNDSYDFPNFYVSNQNDKYYFKELCLSLGTFNYIECPDDMAKTTLFELLTGLEKKNKLSVSKEYLTYDIVYKPKFIQPKFEGNLEEMGIRELNYYYEFMDILMPYLETKVKELPKEILQLVGFLLFINREGVIYIFDYPYDIISIHNRKRMWNIMKEFCRKQNKIGIVSEKDKRTGCTYNIKKISENEYFGMMI